MNSFTDLGVNSFFTEKLKERYIEKPTEIQNLVIPRLFAGKPTVFRSATGTGKTFSFLLPILQTLSAVEEGGESHSPLALICAPTLELCSQIKEEIDFLSPSVQSAPPIQAMPPVKAAPPIRAVLLIGSVKIDKQIEVLRKTKPAIIIGNPGRLLALAKMRKLNLSGLRYLVLDEADRLTAQECLEETKELLALIKRSQKHSQERGQEGGLCCAACSATVGAKTSAQLGPMFAAAEIIESGGHEILQERMEHWAIFSEKRRKVQTLRSLLAALKAKKSRTKALVFTSRGDEAGQILLRLQHHHVSAAGLFSKIERKPLSGAERKEALDSFRKGGVDVLVSTDLAARGLDILGITHVIALDVPQDSEVYIHRCGRTARAGKRGTMVTIGDATQMRLLALMEKKLKIRIQPKELHYGQICAPDDVG